MVIKFTTTTGKKEKFIKNRNILRVVSTKYNSLGAKKI